MPTKRVEEINLHPSVWREYGKSSHRNEIQLWNGTLEVASLEDETGPGNKDRGVGEPV